MATAGLWPWTAWTNRQSWAKVVERAMLAVPPAAGPELQPQGDGTSHSVSW